MSKGVLYVGTNKHFFNESLNSAKTVRNSNPDLNISIITSPDLLKDAKSNPVFTHVIEADKIFDDVRDKAYNIHLSPFEKTLYLDTDICIISDINEVFSLLDQYDIALSHNPYRSICTISGIPESFPEFNGGVILYSNNIKDEFSKLWRENIDNQINSGRPGETIKYKNAESLSEVPFGRKHDQPPLRETIYYSKFDHVTLPREYNFGNNVCLFAGGRVKILHSGSELGPVSKSINKKEIPRVLVRYTGKIYHKDGDINRFGFPVIHRIVAHPKFISLLKSVGIFPLANKIYKKILSWRYSA